MLSVSIVRSLCFSSHFVLREASSQRRVGLRRVDSVVFLSLFTVTFVFSVDCDLRVCVCVLVNAYLTMSNVLFMLINTPVCCSIYFLLSVEHNLCPALCYQNGMMCTASVSDL